MKKIHITKGRAWALGILTFTILLLIIVPYFLSSRHLTGYMERKMNSKMTDYTFGVKSAHFHPLTFALELNNVSLIQNAKSEPPIAGIKQIRASLHWGELLRGHLVSDFLIDEPIIYLNLNNVRKEQESKVPLSQKGWQDALQSIYPFKINVFRIKEGNLTYVDAGPGKPLHLSGITFVAKNIRNIRYPESAYPSTLYMKAAIFEKGTLTLEGRANFLAEPHAGFKGDMELADIDLSYLKPITSRENMVVKSGTLAGKGTMEYAHDGSTTVRLKELSMRGVDIDYIHLPETAAKEQQRVHEAKRAVKEMSNKPSQKIRVDVMKLDGRLGYVDKTKDPNYRIWFDDFHGTLKNFSNQFEEGPAHLELRGKFMGTGNTLVRGTFRPETKNPDFDIYIAIEDTQMPPMSDLFRAYGNFDIKQGLFSFYSELHVENNQVTGYVKPLFKEMKVYDRRQSREKNIFHRLYIGLVGGLSKLLENPPRKEIATQTNISGPFEAPHTSTAQAILNLIRNAFIKAILPGFEKQVSRPGK